MPKLISEIKDSKTVLYRSVVLQIVKDIKELTGFPKEAKIYYKDEVEQVVNLESVMDNNDREMVNFSHENRILIETNFNFNDQSIYNGQPFKGSSRPILYDSIHEIKLSPINYVVEIELTATFIGKDRLTLAKWSNGLRVKLSQSVKAYLHQINYLYPIDATIIDILKHLYETKEKFINEDDDFLKWIAKISYEKITGISNQIGSGIIPVVEQSQIGVIGIWNYTETPKIEKMASGDNYQASYPYKIRLSLPSALTLEYPNILNNNIIDSKYRLACDFNTELVLGSPEKLLWGLYATLDRPPMHYPCVPLYLPCYDEWRAESIAYGTATVYQALITISNNDPTYVMDLIDLGEDYQLAPWLIEIMRLFGDDILINGASPILINLYRNNYRLEHEALTVDDELKLFTKETMQQYNQYHVRLSLYTDLTLLSEKALEMIRVNGELTTSLFKTLGPEFINRIPELLSDGSFKKREMWDFITLLKETEGSYKNGKEIRRFTVGSCLVTTGRNENAISQ